MNYRRIYDELIQVCKIRDWSRKTAPCYVEQHHILPRSFGGSDKKENLVFLTAREHFIAHRLLFLFHTGENKSKMANAWFRMCQMNTFQKRFISGRRYEYARKAFSDNNPFKSVEIIEIVRHRMIANNPMKIKSVAKRQSDSTKGTRTGTENSFYNRKHTLDTRIKMSGPRRPWTEDEKLQKKISGMGKKWYNNGIYNMKTDSADIRLLDRTWNPGRLNNCNLGRPKND